MMPGLLGGEPRGNGRAQPEFRGRIVQRDFQRGAMRVAASDSGEISRTAPVAVTPGRSEAKR